MFIRPKEVNLGAPEIFNIFPKIEVCGETQKSKILTPMSSFKNIYERIRAAQTGGL